MVAQGFFPIEVAVSLLQSGIRRFKMGRSVEDAFEQIDIEQAKASIEQQNQQGQSDPDAEAKAQGLQIKTEEVKQKLQLEVQKFQLKQQEQQADVALEQQKFQLEQQKVAAELQLEREKAGLQLQLEDKKITVNQDKNKSDLDFRRDSELGLPKENLMAEIEDKLTQAIQAIIQTSSQQNEVLAQAVGKMTEAVEELSKPKKLIKDKSGRPIGSQTVDNL